MEKAGPEYQVGLDNPEETPKEIDVLYGKIRNTIDGPLRGVEVGLDDMARAVEANEIDDTAIVLEALLEDLKDLVESVEGLREALTQAQKTE